MIRIDYSIDSPVPFAVIGVGEHLKIIKNPAMTAYLPFWLQQDLANAALGHLVPQPPRRVRRQLAEVVIIDALREAREVRLSKNTDVGT